jgi:methyl-accepting chemotaxis protein
MRIVELVKERLGVRLTLMFVAAAVVPAVIVGVLSFQRASDSLRDLAVAQVQQEATLTTQDLTTFLGQFSTDLLAMSNTPPVQAIIRARDNGASTRRKTTLTKSG